jgi:anaerobic glycerol-3-phosphate dehydrogenase
LPTGPYYALGPVGARLTAGNAGLAIDENLQVLRGETSIEGLYAIGANGQGGMLLQGLGVHIGWAFVSGRLAAQHAMASVRLVRSHSQ